VVEASNGNSDSSRRLRKIEQDLYQWNGADNPPITYRQQRSEDRLDMLEAINTKREQKHDSKMNLLIGAVFTGLVGIGVAIILIVFHLK
jgi:hypothetical protein